MSTKSRQAWRRAAALSLSTRGTALDTETGAHTTLAERVAEIRSTGVATILPVQVPIQRLSLTEAVRATGDSSDTETNPRSIQGVALTYNVVDSYGTLWEPASIERGTPDLFTRLFPFLWFHYRDEPIGVLRVIRTSAEEGLVIEVTYDETPQGDTGLARAKSGSAPNLSVGVLLYLDPNDEDWTRIKVAELVEVSQITLDQQAVPGAALETARSAEAEPLVEGAPAVEGNTPPVAPESTEETPAAPVEDLDIANAPTVHAWVCEDCGGEGTDFASQEDAQAAQAAHDCTPEPQETPVAEENERALTIARARLRLISIAEGVTA